jgi:hypothetical protein
MMVSVKSLDEVGNDREESAAPMGIEHRTSRIVCLQLVPGIFKAEILPHEHPSEYAGRGFSLGFTITSIDDASPVWIWTESAVTQCQGFPHTRPSP